MERITVNLSRSNPYALENIMSIGHVILSHGDGTVSEPRGLHAPEVYDNTHTDGAEDVRVSGDGWTLLRGWTGQYNYRGPCMHPSEFIGGNLAQHILDNPGYYVATTIAGYDDEWVIAFRDSE